MINLMKAEIFRLSKDKFLILVFAIVFFAYASNTILAFAGANCTRYTIMNTSWQEQYFVILKLSVFLICCIWSQEFRYETVKNVFTSGSGIEKFYCAKVAVQFAVCLILFVWALLCYILFFLMLPKDSGDITLLAVEKLKGLGSLLLYSFVEISLLNFIYMIIKKETLMFMIYFFIIEKMGTFLGDVTNISFIETMSIEHGYETALSVFIDTKERIFSAILMLGYALAINAAVYFLLKKGAFSMKNIS